MECEIGIGGSGREVCGLTANIPANIKTLKTYYRRHFLKYTHMHIQMEFLYNKGTMPYPDTLDYQINRLHAMYGYLFLSSWQWDAIGHRSIKYCCCSWLLTITL